jgi:hypothetical protein
MFHESLAKSPQWLLALAVPALLAGARSYARARADILDECLEDMKSGERDLDALASRYPRARDEIRPLLGIGLALLQLAPSSDSEATSSRTPALALTMFQAACGNPPADWVHDLGGSVCR